MLLYLQFSSVCLFDLLSLADMFKNLNFDACDILVLMKHLISKVVDTC
jgi:hypothetical protein